MYNGSCPTVFLKFAILKILESSPRRTSLVEVAFSCKRLSYNLLKTVCKIFWVIFQIIRPKIGNREKHQGKHGKYPKKPGKQ